MSKGLFDARRQLSSVTTMLKQDKVANAVQTMYGGLQGMLREQLLKSERDEFSQIITNAVRALNSNDKIKTHFSIQISYTPGQESALLETIKLLMETMDSVALEEADRIFREREAKKKAMLEQGLAELAAGKTDPARGIFSSLTLEHPDDVSMLVEISEGFEKAGQLQDAVMYMEKAAALDPDSAYIQNRLGILYRKSKIYDKSEAAFAKAQSLTPDDAYIYFNKGRLYLDCEKWQLAKDAAMNALLLQPSFIEAEKLAEYAAKRI